VAAAEDRGRRAGARARTASPTYRGQLLRTLQGARSHDALYASFYAHDYGQGADTFAVSAGAGQAQLVVAVSLQRRQGEPGRYGAGSSAHSPRLRPLCACRCSRSTAASATDSCVSAGVGILFVEEEDPSGFVRVTVKALIEGGSAERTGMVRAGDMVVRVGNQDVIGKPLSVLRTMIPGPIGSYCRLGFLRGGVALNSNAVQVSQHVLRV
jgi:hypothetical protein